jgi:SAM-dependent methyltransferase
MSTFKVALIVSMLAGCARPATPKAEPKTAGDPPPAAPGAIVEKLRADAHAAAALCRVPWVREFLAATADLPSIAPRALYRDSGKTRFYTEAQFAALPEAERRALVRVAVDEEFYYTTRYGSPIAYCRALDLIGVDGVAGKRVLDFGYGTIGHLRLLATLGAHVTGVDVDPLLPVLYGAPGDQGAVRDGSVALVSGHFPGDPTVRASVGGDYDLIISKNTLKNGYVHPLKPDPRFAIGVDDASFLRALYDALKPGGRLMIYNLSPAPNGPGRPYRAWADGRTPFPRALFETTGFHVLMYERDDTATARALGHALGWDREDPPMDLEHDLFGVYTLVEKPAS